MEEDITMGLSTHISVGNIVRHLEVGHQIVIHRRAMRRRLYAENERSMPRYKYAMKFIGNLFYLRTDDHGVQFKFRIVGSDKALYEIWWTFTEWVKSYRIYGIVPGIIIDWKEI